MGARQDTLAGRSTQRLREAILTLRLESGTQLVEREMVDSLDVSRTSVRAALQSLEAEGLVVRGRRGVFAVATVSPDVARQIYEVPAALEPAMARLQRADPDGLLYMLFPSRGFANTMKYRSERVGALLDQVRTLYDVSTRKKFYVEVQQQIVDDLPMVSLIFGAEYAALHASVNGFERIPDEVPRFRDLWKTAS